LPRRVPAMEGAPLLSATPVPVDQYNPNDTWDVTKPAPPPSHVRGGGCRDAFWAALFVAHFVAVIVLAVALGVPSVKEVYNAESGDSGTVHFAGLPLPGSFMRTIAISFLVAAVVSALAVRWLEGHADIAINTVLGMAVFMYIAGGIACMATKFISAGAVLLFFGLIALLVWWKSQARIRFAAANLSAGCAAVQDYPATIGVALGSVLVQFIWVLVWFLAMFGVVHKTQNDHGKGHYAAYAYMSFCLIWGQQVCHYLMYVTVSGVTGSWWFGTGDRTPTLGALRRALSTSFGSIAFGAALLALVQTLRMMANSARRQRGGRGSAALVMACLACAASCLLRCTEDFLRFFNKYAFVYVGVYGKSYCGSGKEVADLFRTRGWSTIINDDLVSLTLAIGALAVGAISGGIGFLIHYASTTGSSVTGSDAIAGVAAMCMGFFIAFCCTAVLTAAVTTVFVCFASAPEALKNTHPEHFAQLLGTWLEVHPELMAACGYTYVRFQIAGPPGGAGGYA